MVRNFLLAAVLAFAGSQAVALPVTITGYDVANTKLTGFGGWNHVYTGTITPNGGLYNYSGGSGTLNNGTGTGTQNTHLFWIPDNPVITLYLDGYYTLNSLILETWSSGNYIPGTLAGFSAAIGPISDTFSTSNGPNRSELASFNGSDLDGLSTNTLTLSNFTGGWNNYFAISNILIDGNAANGPTSVPEPGSLALLGLGLIGLGIARRKQAS